MSININQVMEYLDTHPLRLYKGDLRSLLELLHGIFAESNPVDSLRLREKYGSLDGILEQLGFDYGLMAGMQLMSEINALP